MKLKLLIFVCSIAILLFSGYFFGGLILDRYITREARNLIRLEKEGRLSRDYGYVWQEINLNKRMRNAADNITGNNIVQRSDSDSTIRKSILDFPSLQAVAELNTIRSLYKTISITDRYGITLAELRTTHTCIQLPELPAFLLQSLLFTEDKNFNSRAKAYEYKSLVRASVLALLRTLFTLRLHYPQGSSTIHMQVARELKFLSSVKSSD